MNLESSISYADPRQVYRYTSSVHVKMDRTIVSATYGVHDRVDIGVIAPMGSATVSGFSSYYQLYDGEESDQSNRQQRFVVRDRGYRHPHESRVDVATHRFDAAAAVDVRLPTGDPDKLMGTGHTQAKIMFIGGSTWGSLTPHVNLGYTLRRIGHGIRRR